MRCTCRSTARIDGPPTKDTEGRLRRPTSIVYVDRSDCVLHGGRSPLDYLNSTPYPLNKEIAA